MVGRMVSPSLYQLAQTEINITQLTNNIDQLERIMNTQITRIPTFHHTSNTQRIPEDLETEKLADRLAEEIYNIETI